MNSFITPIKKLSLKQNAILHPIYDYTVISSYHFNKLNSTSPKYDVLRAGCSLIYKGIYMINPNLIPIPVPVRYDFFDIHCKLKVRYYFIGFILSLMIHFTFNYFIVTGIYILNRLFLRSNKHFGTHFTSLLLFYLYVFDLTYLIFF